MPERTFAQRMARRAKAGIGLSTAQAGCRSEHSQGEWREGRRSGPPSVLPPPPPFSPISRTTGYWIEALRCPAPSDGFKALFLAAVHRKEKPRSKRGFLLHPSFPAGAALRSTFRTPWLPSRHHPRPFHSAPGSCSPGTRCCPRPHRGHRWWAGPAYPGSSPLAASIFAFDAIFAHVMVLLWTNRGVHKRDECSKHRRRVVPLVSTMHKSGCMPHRQWP